MPTSPEVDISIPAYSRAVRHRAEGYFALTIGLIRKSMDVVRLFERCAPTVPSHNVPSHAVPSPAVPEHGLLVSDRQAGRDRDRVSVIDAGKMDFVKVSAKRSL